MGFRRNACSLSGFSIQRREFLGISAGACWAFLNAPTGVAADRQFKFSEYPFSLGVASGDPRADSVVLWTRLAPEPLEGGGMPPEDVKVDWELAEDEGFKTVVQSGSATASPQWAHSVHVEVEGLRPDRVYWYRFRCGGEVSPVGRTRTAPAAGVMLDKFRFAFASCQNYEYGYLTAYDHMVQDDLNLVVHLGDYIYESATKDRTRRHPGGVAKTLAQYRNRYALYKLEAPLQKAHAAFPWIVTWDDHEVVNNWSGDNLRDPDGDLGAFLKRRAAAFQAYYEHMPLRKPQVPTGHSLQLYRNVNFGQLIQFAVLDTRQYRTLQPCGDGTKAPCDEMLDPNATMLGAKQEMWLMNTLLNSTARWNVLAQQVMMGRIDRAAGEEVKYSMDQWSGYDAARRRLLGFVSERQISNPVVITGDIHSNWVNDLKVDFDQPEQPTVATEFVGTSITSGGDGSDGEKYRATAMAENPFLKFYNSQRGYVRCEITQDRWQSDYRVLDYVSKPGSPCRTRAKFVVENGQRGAQEG